MKNSKLMAIILVIAMMASLALAGCGNGGEETPTNDNGNTTNVEENNDANTGDETSSNTESELADEQVIKMNWGSEPPILDPQRAQDSASGSVILDTMDGLIRLNENGEIVQGSGMAESWTVSEDGTVYTFTIRDAVWEDDVAVSANDFAFAWKRAMDPKLASTYAFMTYDIKNAEAFNKGEVQIDEVGVKAVDEKTLEVTLERPNPAFLSKLQHYTFFPGRQDLIEQWGDKYGSDKEYYISCGPFVMETWEHESTLDLVKNDKYWDKENVIIDKIEGVMIANVNTSVNLYETGDLDWITVSPVYLDKYKEDLKQYSRASTSYYKYNVENEFFSNKKIRQAFSYAIDRKAIVAARNKNMFVPGYGFVPPGMPGKDGQSFRDINGVLYQDVGDLGEEAVAKLLEEGLAEIGKTKDDINGIKFLTFDGDNALQLAQIWQQYWKNVLGVDVEIEQATFKIKISRENSGDFAFSYASWIGDYNDALTFMDMWITGGDQNTCKWSNAEYDELIKVAQTSSDQNERIDAMLKAEKILMDEMPIAPYLYGGGVYVQTPKLKGVVRLPLQIDHGMKTAYKVK